MKINELFNVECDINIFGIMEDSRQHKTNSIYFCLTGLVNDGHDFIDQAIKNGAVVIVHSKEITNHYTDVLYIKVKNPLEEMLRVTQLLYDFPSKKINTIGITGTNGKTTIATVIYHLLNSMNLSCGYMGTNGTYLPSEKYDTELTTVSNVLLNEMLAKMVRQEAKYVALEVSSHGLSLNRVNNTDFDVAIFTNLTHDHLDFHKTIEDYALAKAKLFEMLDIEDLAIVNLDDKYGSLMIEHTKGKVITYGLKNALADYRAINIDFSLSGTSFDLLIRGSFYKRIETNLIAQFNVYNLLAVIVFLDHYNLLSDQMIGHFKNIPVVDGRFEQFNIEGIDYIVDYAHTPDGHEQLYKFFKNNFPEKRIISLFGSPGKRDIDKRYILGQLADYYADEVILTTEDSRNEDPNEIAQQIASSISKKPIHIILDRKTAIEYSYKIAKPGDVVLVLGKGRERFNELLDSDDYDGDDFIVQTLNREL